MPGGRRRRPRRRARSSCPATPEPEPVAIAAGPTRSAPEPPPLPTAAAEPAPLPRIAHRIAVGDPRPATAGRAGPGDAAPAIAAHDPAVAARRSVGIDAAHRRRGIGGDAASAPHRRRIASVGRRIDAAHRPRHRSRVLAGLVARRLGRRWPRPPRLAAGDRSVRLRATSCGQRLDASVAAARPRCRRARSRVRSSDARSSTTRPAATTRAATTDSVSDAPQRW